MPSIPIKKFMSASLALKHLRYELDAGFIDYDRDRFPDKTVRQKKRIALTKRIDMAAALLDSIADPSTLTPPFKRRLRQMRRKLFGKQRSYEGENAFRVFPSFLLVYHVFRQKGR